MTYVMSDLHGQYELYKKMLEKIHLSDEDTLYILGDVVDRGPGGIAILLDMMERTNIIPLVGNHDWTMMALFKNQEELVAKMGKEGLVSLYEAWFCDGGETTYRAFMALDGATQQDVLEYVDSMNYLQNVRIAGKKYYLSHTVPEYHEGIVLEKCPAGDFIHGEPDYDIEYFPDAVLITGHTPTDLIEKSYKGRIYQRNHHIALDCGAGFGGPLGCLCLETGEEFYVKQEEC